MEKDPEKKSKTTRRGGVPVYLERQRKSGTKEAADWPTYLLGEVWRPGGERSADGLFPLHRIKIPSVRA